MEIKELITVYLNNFEQLLEVTFRIDDDSEDICRYDKIPFLDLSDFGYNFHEKNNMDIFDEYYIYNEDDVLFDNDDEIISFLIEYYSSYSNKLPKPELY